MSSWEMDMSVFMEAAYTCIRNQGLEGVIIGSLYYRTFWPYYDP